MEIILMLKYKVMQMLYLWKFIEPCNKCNML